MASEPDEAFIRNYFAGYERENDSFALINFPVTPDHDLEDCNCKLNCCFKFSLHARLLLRAGYQMLTPAGRTAFLAAHTREPSPSQTQYNLPIMGMGLEKVCRAHFLNTLQESNGRVRQVVRNKRETNLPEEEEDEDDLMDCASSEVPGLGRKQRRAIRLARIERGLSYIMPVTKRLAPARKVKAPCNAACNYKCFERFPLGVRQQMLKELLQMPLAEQRKYLADHLCRVAPKRRRIVDGKPSLKRFTNYYFFEKGRKLHKVCKTMFLNTYDITDRGVRNLLIEKGAAEHVICGNPELAKVVKRENGIVFDIDGDSGKTLEEESEEEDFPVDIGTVKVEEIRAGLDETEQEILPDSGDASEASNVPIKLEIVKEDEGTAPEFPLTAVDIKTEDNPPDDEYIDDQEGEEDDDTATESQSEESLLLEKLPDRKATKKENSTRAVKPDCSASCLMYCVLRVSEELRQQLLADLLKMAPAKQNKFIGDHICAMYVVKPRSLTDRRALSYHYFLPVDSRLTRVCKTMFLNTFDVSDKIVRNILSKKGTDRHVVCGNPNFPPLLMKGGKLFFDYDEGGDESVLVSQHDWEERCKCHLQCESKFPEKSIAQIQNNFQKKLKPQQDTFLVNHIRLLTDKKNLCKNLLFRARFFLPLGSTVREVCRTTFLRTFKLTANQVSTLLSKYPHLLVEIEDPLELAKEHIAAHRQDVDHYCVESGGIVKLSHCPDVVRMYNEYLERSQLGVEPIGYRQYYTEFSMAYAKTGLLLPTKCPDCGFFERGNRGG
ncbi:hypothetical protein quinque_003532 [Culex quinquefasciatus]